MPCAGPHMRFPVVTFRSSFHARFGRKRLAARFGIRARLVLLVLSLLLPFLAYLFAGASRESQNEHEHARSQVIAVAELMSARLDDQVNNIWQLLATLSHTLGATPADAAHNDELLQRLKASLPARVDDVAVWTTQGENIGALDPDLRRRSTSVTEERFFKSALHGDGFAVEAPVRAARDGQFVAVFAMPLVQDGRKVGVVSASMRLLDLQSVLDPKASLPAGTVITVRDMQGVVLARSIDAAAWIGRTILRTSAPAQSHRGIAIEGAGADGRDRLAGLVSASVVPWSVYVGIPRDIALEAAQSRFHRHVAVGGLILLFGLVLAAWVAESVSRPLHQLAGDAAILAAGDLAHRSKVAVGGETGLLSRTLNRMAEALQERSAALLGSEERLREVTDNVPALVSYLDRELRFRFANRAYRDWLEVDPASLIGQSLAELYGVEAVSRFQQHLDAALTGERVLYERELPTPSGVRHVQVTLVPHQPRLPADASVDGLYVLMHDITARREAESRLRQLAQYDSLTGLPNRWLFHDRLRTALARAQRCNGHLAVLFIDIDHFKPVNDVYGHDAGDQLLCEVARRLQAGVRGSDTVARLGGDEFTLILEDLADTAAASAMAARLVASLRHSVLVHTHGKSHEVKVSASIGIALQKPGDAPDDDGAALLRRADRALYRVKQAGRNGYREDAVSAFGALV